MSKNYEYSFYRDSSVYNFGVKAPTKDNPSGGLFVSALPGANDTYDKTKSVYFFLNATEIMDLVRVLRSSKPDKVSFYHSPTGQKTDTTSKSLNVEKKSPDAVTIQLSYRDKTNSQNNIVIPVSGFNPGTAWGLEVLAAEALLCATDTTHAPWKNKKQSQESENEVPF